MAAVNPSNALSLRKVAQSSGIGVYSHLRRRKPTPTFGPGQSGPTGGPSSLGPVIPLRRCANVTISDIEARDCRFSPKIEPAWPVPVVQVKRSADAGYQRAKCPPEIIVW